MTITASLCLLFLAAVARGCDLAATDRTTSLYVDQKNVPPVARPQPDQQIPWRTPSYALNGTASYDPDEGPRALTLYWKVCSTPYDPLAPPFTIADPTAPLVTLDTRALRAGSYLFVLYASDAQAIAAAVFNLTVLK